MAKNITCCVEQSLKQEHPDHSKELHRVNRVRGQLDGIARMIEEGRYCPDIIVQIQATRAALGALQSAVLGKHLRECVRAAFESKDKKGREEQIEELLALFSKS